MKRPRPRKVIATVLVFLFLGAVVNVAVAWSCALWSSPNLPGASSWYGAPPPDMDWWIAQTEWTPAPATEAFVYCAEAWISRGPGIALSEYVETRDINPTYDGDVHSAMVIASPFGIHIATGWPCKSFEGGARVSLNPNSGFRGTMFVVKPTLVIEGPGNVRGALGVLPRLVPLALLWPGFAINTLFYAAILWLIFAAPFALRRCRRIKRGLCPACAYPVGASDLCTECGKPVTRRPHGSSASP